MSGMPPHAPEAQLRGMAEARLAGTPPVQRQINALSRELGREQPFPLTFLNADVERGSK